jgi:GTP-binding protein
MLRTSGDRGHRRPRLPAVLSQVHERWNRRAPTARVNEVVAAAQAEQQAPGGIRYRYATQVAAAPPRFVLFGAAPPAASYQRFLEGRLRRALDLEGVPIAIRFRQGRRRPR